MELEHKVDLAIKLLRAIPKDGPVEISYSAGKDSDVILELAKMAGIDYRAIYKMTTIDPPGTIQHAREMGAEVLRPKMSFYEIICKKGWPNRRARFCCQYLKEYKILDRAVQGIRRAESAKRAARYKEPEYCWLYSKGEKARIYLPILEWTTEDVARFIEERGIKCAPHYYDEQGCFHPERRLGCMCCPLQSKKSRREEFKKYPGMLKFYLRGGQEFFDTHPDSKMKSRFDGNIYDKMLYELFFDRLDDYEKVMKPGLFLEDKVDSKAFLEDYFGMDLTIKKK